jgi:hypothetical protein
MPRYVHYEGDNFHSMALESNILGNLMLQIQWRNGIRRVNKVHLYIFFS